MTAGQIRTREHSGRIGAAGILFSCLLTTAEGRLHAAEGAFSYDWLVQQAQKRARQPFSPPDRNVPPALSDLNYDGYRAIRYKEDEALWSGQHSQFWAEFYLRGYLFRRRAEIFIVDKGKVTPALFSTNLFDYSASPIRPEQVPYNLGFSGFRLLYPINKPDHHDEFISFLGKSYFRAIGQDEMYGASTRGLAIDLGSPGEDFPYFATFWIERPSASADRIATFALLDDPNLTGAYRFDIQPGPETVVDVEARIFARTSLNNMGLAPMTSMFFVGPNGPYRLEEERPQVHDSDGLLIVNSAGSWIWRPLWNPAAVSLSSLDVNSVAGFGLMQRDRNPLHYRNDKGALFPKRPNIWVEPSEPWNGGILRLSELPSMGEGQDSIAACWMPPENMQTQRTASIRYRLHFGSAAPAGHDIGEVVQTHWFEMPDSRTHFDVDFSEQRGSTATPPTPTGVATARNGQVGPVQVQKDPTGRYWRAGFDMKPDPNKIAELRVHLESGGRCLTEVWSFAWPR